MYFAIFCLCLRSAEYPSCKDACTDWLRKTGQERQLQCLEKSHSKNRFRVQITYRPSAKNPEEIHETCWTQLSEQTSWSTQLKQVENKHKNRYWQGQDMKISGNSGQTCRFPSMFSGCWSFKKLVVSCVVGMHGHRAMWNGHGWKWTNPSSMPPARRSEF